MPYLNQKEEVTNRIRKIAEGTNTEFETINRYVTEIAIDAIDRDIKKLILRLTLDDLRDDAISEYRHWAIDTLWNAPPVREFVIKGNLQRYKTMVLDSLRVEVRLPLIDTKVL